MNTTLGPAKAVSAGFFGALTIVVVWGAKAGLGIEIPDFVAQAITVLTSTAATWFTPTTAQ